MEKKLTNKEEFKEIIKEGKWLVDFNAKWCGPCRMLEPVLENISKDYNVLKVDVDEFQELALEYGIMSIPALLVFDNNKITKQEIGYKDEDEIKELLK